jgi:hypothetical protein
MWVNVKQILTNTKFRWMQNYCEHSDHRLRSKFRICLSINVPAWTVAREWLLQPEVVKHAMPVYHVHNNEDWQQPHGSGNVLPFKTAQIILSSWTVQKEDSLQHLGLLRIYIYCTHCEVFNRSYTQQYYSRFCCWQRTSFRTGASGEFDSAPRWN